MKPQPDFTWDDIDALRDEARLTAVPPPGTFNEIGYAKRYGFSRCKAHYELDRLVLRGKVERVGKFLVNGKWTVYYRLIKKAAKR